MAQPVEGLGSYDDLLAWAERAALLSAGEGAQLRQRAASEASAASSVHAHAIALREAMHRLFVALARGDEVPALDLATINGVLGAGAMHAAIVPTEGDFAFRTNDDDLALPLWRLADSAAHLLISGQWRRVRECAGHDCGWLFLDTTKNGNRRWCDSADCGNRARVRAHYQRRHARVSEQERQRTTTV
jgi:predicted RNA-binding Zn ribbon-like protein